MRYRLCFVAVVSALAAAATPALGQTIIGTNGGANMFPFISYGSQHEYQQVYAASAFSGPLLISSINFFDTSSPNSTFSGQTFTISFSETSSVTPSNITNSYASNIGVNSAVFFSGVLSGPATALIYGSYAYDNALGNLLMDVVVSGTASGGGGLDAGDDANVGRAYDNNAGRQTHYGLVTEFNGTPLTTVTPEPATMALLGTGLLGIGLIRRRRRNKTA